MSRHQRSLLIRSAVVAAILPARALIAGHVVADGSVGAASTLSGPNFSIPAALGRQVGPNLFHSFSTFNLDKGDVATFTASASTRAILARVTGGSASNIDGTIATRLDTSPTTPHPAAFYLINPAGVIFGPDARLDTGGSFVVTTADTVQLADGGHFDASTPQTSVLTSAAPAAFGFLKSIPQPVTVNGSTLTVPAGKLMSVVGGGIQMTGATVQTPGGVVNLVSVASPGNIPAGPRSSHSKVAAQSVAAAGDISLSNSMIDVDGPSGGQVVARGGMMTLTESPISAHSLGSGNGRGIDIDLSGDLSMSGGFIEADTQDKGSAGPVRIVANDISLDQGTDDFVDISSDSTASGIGGHAGMVQVQAASLRLGGAAFLSATTSGLGAAGTVHVNAGTVALDGQDSADFNGFEAQSLSDGRGGAPGNVQVRSNSLQMLNGAQIATSTFGLGRSGDITVRVSGQAIISGQGAQGADSGVYAESSATGPSGAAGNIHFTAGSLQLEGGAEINSTTTGMGKAGDILVNVLGPAVISGADAQVSDSGITAQSNSSGPSGSAGNIRFKGGSLQLLGGATMSTSTSGRGRGGSLTVDVSGQATFSGSDADGFDSSLYADSGSSGAGGPAGNIHFTAGSLQLLDGAFIRSTTFGLGRGGDVTVNVSGQAIFSGADVDVSDSGIFAQTESSGAGGSAGDIHLDAANLQLLDGATISSSTYGLARGGDLAVKVSGEAIMSGADADGDDSGLNANTLASGRSGSAGNIHFAATSLQLLNGAQINSSTFGLGRGGNVTVAVSGQAILSGADADDASDTSGVYSNSQPSGAGGSAGTIHFRAARLQLLGAAEISSTTFGLGTGGDVAVNVSGSALISGADPENHDSGVYADSQSADAGGSAGSIHFHAATLQLLDGGSISSSTSGLGRGGDVAVNVSEQAMISGTDAGGNDSGIDADTLSTGAGGSGGSIRLSAAGLHLLNGAQINSSTFGLGRGGNVEIAVSGQAIFSGSDTNSAVDTSGIYADSESSSTGGSAGTIHFRAASLQLLEGAEISSTTFGMGTGGDVRVAVRKQLIASGEIAGQYAAGIVADSDSDAAGGGAGSVHVSAANLQLLDAGVISSSTSGLGEAGDVVVRVSGKATISGFDSDNIINTSGVDSDSFSTGAGGPAGNIHFSAANLQLLAGGEISSSTRGAGQGGDITVGVRGAIIASGDNGADLVSAVVTNSLSSAAGGSAGSIHLAAGELHLSDAAEISSSTFGLGRGGDVTINVSGQTMISGADVQGANSAVLARSNSSDSGGPAGTIRLWSGALGISQDGQISSSTDGSGAGGDVRIIAGRLTIAGNGTIDTGIFAQTHGTNSDSGQGGNIKLFAKDLQLESGGVISAASLGPAVAGDVLVQAVDISLSGEAVVESSAAGSGNGGSLTVQAESRIRLLRGSTITAFSSEGNGGDIRISSGESITMDESSITTDAAEDGGNIRVAIPARIQIRDGSRIETSSGTNGGNISIDPIELTLSDSAIHANGGSNGGRINIAADVSHGAVFNGPGANVTATGATGISGSVELTPSDYSLIGGLVPLPGSLVLPGARLIPQCGQSLDSANASSFIVTGYGGAPPEPGGWVTGEIIRRQEESGR